MSKLIYRFAARGDLAALVRLRHAFLAEAGQDVAQHPKVAKATKAYFAKMLPKGHIVVSLAECDGAIVGVCVMIFDHHLPRLAQPTGLAPYIMNMYVVPEFRRQKIATKLLQMLIVKARQAGAHIITLHYWPGKMTLYEKAGFTLREREMQLQL